MSDSPDEVEQKFLEETKLLLEMDDEARVAYVVDMIKWLTSRLKWVGRGDGKIKQAKRYKKLMEEFREKGEEVVACALFSIKAEFRPVWISVLGELVGMEEVEIGIKIPGKEEKA